jgi:hypothetical protein
MTRAPLPAIPPPLEHDPEDVFWALSTATTLWSRSEHAEALKWLRRAAEQAASQGVHARSLELTKAVTDLTVSLALPPAAAPPPPSVGASRPPPSFPSRPPPPPPIPPRPIMVQDGSSKPVMPGTIRPPGSDGAAAPRSTAPAPRPPAPARPGSVVPPPPSAPAAPPATVPKPAPAPSSAVRAPSPGSPAQRGRERITSTNRRAAIATAKRAEPARGGRGSSASIPDTLVDDLDEDTSVIDGKRSAAGKAGTARKAADQGAASKPAEANAATAPPAKVPVRKGTMQQVDEGFESLLQSAPPAAPPAPAPKAVVAAPAAKATPAPPPKAPVVTPAAKAPVEVPPIRPAASPAQASPSGLLAQRVAVVAGPDGEARILTMEGLTSLPEGAIAAIVVPLAGGDGEPLARLLRGRRPEV